VHAGKGFGGVDIPRIGEEVIVGFLEGSPDLPIIIGRVYNGLNAPPNGLPTAGMVSGLKSNSTPGGGGNNAMMMDDTKGKEKISIHGQYNMDTTVENDHAITVVSGNDTHTVSTGTRTVTVKGAVKEIFQDTQDTAVTNAISITSGTAHIYVHGSTNIQLHVGASMIWMDSGGQINIQGVNVAINGSSSVTIKGGIVHSEADSENQVKGAIVLTEGTATNTVKGGMVMLNP
jgi:type VI secretion system secreted protein VgrG